MIGESAQYEPAKDAAKSEGVRIPLTVNEAPSRQVIWCEVMSEMSVAAGEGNCITQDGATNGISYGDDESCKLSSATQTLTWAKTCTIHQGLSLFCLQADVQLQTIDISV